MNGQCASYLYWFISLSLVHSSMKWHVFLRREFFFLILFDPFPWISYLPMIIPFFLGERGEVFSFSYLVNSITFFFFILSLFIHNWQAHIFLLFFLSLFWIHFLSLSFLSPSCPKNLKTLMLLSLFFFLLSKNTVTLSFLFPSPDLNLCAHTHSLIHDKAEKSWARDRWQESGSAVWG